MAILGGSPVRRCMCICNSVLQLQPRTTHNPFRWLMKSFSSKLHSKHPTRSASAHKYLARTASGAHPLSRLRSQPAEHMSLLHCRVGHAICCFQHGPGPLQHRICRQHNQAYSENAAQLTHTSLSCGRPSREDTVGSGMRSSEHDTCSICWLVDQAQPHQT